MTLREARVAFSACIGLLLQYVCVIGNGYEAALDEGLDRLTVKDPTTDHLKTGVHGVGLGQDLVLYKDGVYLRNTVDYEFLGRFWENLGTKKGIPLVWGGRFSDQDGNHFSMEWQGRK